MAYLRENIQYYLLLFITYWYGDYKSGSYSNRTFKSYFSTHLMNDCLSYRKSKSCSFCGFIRSGVYLSEFLEYKPEIFFLNSLASIRNFYTKYIFFVVSLEAYSSLYWCEFYSIGYEIDDCLFESINRDF